MSERDEFVDASKAAVNRQVDLVSRGVDYSGRSFRVLVTGSRIWADQPLLRIALSECALAAAGLPAQLVVVHGACRSGADSMADRWATWAHHAGWNVDPPERHPADWKGPCRTDRPKGLMRCRPGHRRPDPRGYDTCPAAGFYRNEDMVNLGADVCLAFIVDAEGRSKGTRHCIEAATKAGIDVVKFEA